MEPFPTTIGRYFVDQLVGAGAMGRVYKAHDGDLRRTVAIKLVSTSLMSSNDRSVYIRRFRREAEAAARCVHPNIVTIYDFALHDGEPFLAMEFVYGASLRQALDEKPVMAVPDAIDVALQVLNALEATHAQGVVHRDIKPANVMLTPSKQVKVSDFGVARIANTETTTAFISTGTPGYMSPEQCRGEPVDGRTDLFAVGTTLFEMVAGQHAYSGRTVTELSHRIQTEPLPQLPADVQAVAPRLQEVLERATAKHPNDRFGSADELAAALRGVPASKDDVTLRLRGSNKLPSVSSSHELLHDTPSRRATEGGGEILGPETWSLVEGKLRGLVGPIAPFLLRSAVRRSRSVDQLCTNLIEAVPAGPERERFRREIEPLLLHGGTGPTEASSFPGRLASPILEQELARAQAALTQFVGPIAGILVRRVAAHAPTVDALWQGLAQHLPSPAEKAAFLQHRRR
jgi:serine/threonine-protein kinase